MPSRLTRFATSRSWLAAFVAGALLVLPACTGPGLEPPKDRSEDSGGGVLPTGGVGASGMGASGTSGGGAPAASGSGAGAAGVGGTGGGGDVAEPIDAGVDAGDSGLDEDAGALR